MVVRIRPFLSLKLRLINQQSFILKFRSHTCKNNYYSCIDHRCIQLHDLRHMLVITKRFTILACFTFKGIRVQPTCTFWDQISTMEATRVLIMNFKLQITLSEVFRMRNTSILFLLSGLKNIPMIVVKISIIGSQNKAVQCMVSLFPKRNCSRLNNAMKQLPCTKEQTSSQSRSLPQWNAPPSSHYHQVHSHSHYHTKLVFIIL